MKSGWRTNKVTENADLDQKSLDAASTADPGSVSPITLGWEQKHFSAESKAAFLNRYAHETTIVQLQTRRTARWFHDLAAEMAGAFDGALISECSDWCGLELELIEGTVLDAEHLQSLQDRCDEDGALFFVSEEDPRANIVTKFALVPTTDSFEILSAGGFAPGGNFNLGVEEFLLRFKVLDSLQPFRFTKISEDAVAGIFFEQPKDMPALAEVFRAMHADSCMVGKLDLEETEIMKIAERLREYYRARNDFFFHWS